MIEAAHFMQESEENADAVAGVATNTGHSKEVCKEALRSFLGIESSGRRKMTVCHATNWKPLPGVKKSAP